MSLSKFTILSLIKTSWIEHKRDCLWCSLSAKFWKTLSGVVFFRIAAHTASFTAGLGS